MAGVNNPDSLVVNLPILPKEEQVFLAKQLCGPELNKFPFPSLIKWFEENAKSDGEGENVAIISKTRLLTYYELNIHANRMAHYLLDRGVKQGDIVAVCLETSIYLFASLLAIMKIGATYLPLDPTYPVKQTNFVLNDAKPSALITREKLANTRFLTFEKKLIRIDQDQEWNDIKEQKKANPNIGYDPNAIAYIIYTSGSTGTPKGVKISYHNIYCSMLARFQYYKDLQPKPLKLLLLLSTSFDTSIAAIFWPLLQKGKIILLKPTQTKNPKNILKKVLKHKINTFICVPALYQKILEYSLEQKSALEQIKLIIVGGDTLQNELVKLHKKTIPQANLVNEYGLTEVSIWSTAKVIYDAQNHEIKPITIGMPIPGEQIFILDPHLQMVSTGMIGELYLGGDKVSPGYINREQLNNKRFIEYLQPNGKIIRLYRTGDLCRYTIEGIKFEGRVDYQVKIRGIRIELEQIEKHILKFPNIKECVVTTKEINGTKHLVAYLILKDQDVRLAINLSKLRIFLAKNLPEYMVPVFFVSMDKLPLSRNNKIDRNALPVPKLSQRQTGRPYTQPRNLTEQSLVNILTYILKIEEIGIYDNFFEIGGTSLDISSFIMRVEKYFNMEISVSKFIKDPTIANLAGIINKETDQSDLNDLLELMKRDCVLDKVIRLPVTSSFVPLLQLKKQVIFLTGATGFLGVNLLKDFVANKYVVYCLVRAETEVQAKTKLKNILINNRIKINLGLCLETGKIKIIVGDLSKSKFGLSNQEFQDLAQQVDVIHHCGAQVHHIYDYQKLQGANVQGTITVLELATAANKLKPIYYFSDSSAAMGEVNSEGAVEEKFITSKERMAQAHGGYAQTKWVAEHLLVQANSRGIPVVILRICCWLLGDTENGICPTEQNHFLSLVKACIQMKCAPQWDNLLLNIFPVNIVSKSIMKIFQQNKLGREGGMVYNVHNIYQISWLKLLKWINVNYKYNISIIEPKAWQAKLKEISQDNALYPLKLHYHNVASVTKPIIQIKNTIKDENMRETMKEAKLSYPNLDDGLLKTYFSYLFSSGFISVSPFLNDLDVRQFDF